MSKDVLSGLVEALRAVEVPAYRDEGICNNVLRVISRSDQRSGGLPAGAHDAWLQDNFARWPKYSGRRSFPVPHPTMAADDAYHETLDLWDGATPYGAARHELRKFLLARAEKQLRGCVFAEALLDLRDAVLAGSEVENTGICHAVVFKSGPWASSNEVKQEWMWWLSAAVKEWPEFSGNLTYPVPFGGDVTPYRAYWDALDNGTLWDCNTSYGAARMRLLDFLINRAEKEANGDF